MVGKSINRREHIKEKFGGTINITKEECYDRLLKYVEKCENLSIKVPQLPSLKKVEMTSEGWFPWLPRKKLIIL